MNEQVKQLRSKLQDFLGFVIPEGRVSIQVEDEKQQEGYLQQRIFLSIAEREKIPAYLLMPPGDGPFPAVLVHHQHGGQWHLGKSEVCGLVGDPLQAFGPVLAREGIVVLAPDALCFEDRRHHQQGTVADLNADWMGHYNEMAYRLVQGELLMTKVLEDASIGISLLSQLTQVDSNRLGLLGHSYGGQTTLFQGALDQRINFACASGAVTSYRVRMEEGTGIERAAVIPGFSKCFEVDDLLKLFASRRLLVVSATEDKYSRDATELCDQAKQAYSKWGVFDRLEHHRCAGGHSLTRERYDLIVNWMINAAKD